MKTSTTELSPADADTTRHRFGHFLAVLGIALYTGLFWGLLGTVFAMIQAFHVMSRQGAANPADLAEHVSLAISTTSIGGGVGIVGAAIIGVSVLFTGYRGKWLYSWAIGLSVVWCIAAFPVGLILGLSTIGLFTSRRSEFKQNNKPNKAEMATPRKPSDYFGS